MDAVYHKPSRTRSTTWVPRRVFYVLRHLQRTLVAGKAQAISNKQIQTAIRFGSEGEVSQIMRWLSGEAPTMGRWAYGHLQANAQQYRFITRERLPSGGYSVTLLATPERIDAPRLAVPQVVQLSFFDDKNDPSMIPHAPQQDASQEGSFSHDPFDGADLRQSNAPDRRSQGDQHEERSHESNRSSVGTRGQIYDWSHITISGAQWVPVAALEKAGVTPDALLAADRTIATRCEYDRDTQVRILFRSLIDHQPIYSASEIAARTMEEHHGTAAAAPRTHGAGTRRRSYADRGQRHAADAPIPDAGRDAEFAAMRAEFERIAAERRAVPTV